MLDGNGQICDACMHGKYGNCVARKCIKRSTIKSVLAALESKVASRRGAHKRIDRIIAPSQFMKEKLIEGGLPSKKITVLHNFVNPTPLLHDTTQQYQTKTNPYFLFFGRLSREKGVDVLIEAYLSILENLPRPIKLMIVGDGPSRKSLEELVEAKQAHHNVCFAGFQTGEVLRRYVSNACFTVVCSRCYENYPYSVVESFSLNTPVIGSRIGGIPELVVEGDTGFLCDHGDSDDLGRAMLKAVSISNREYANMRNRCNRYVAEECSKEAHFSSLIRIYESAIDTYGDK